MATTIDSFLDQISQSINSHDGRRIASLFVLDFDGLPPSQQKPYADLHSELNARFAAGKDAALSTKVKTKLSTDVLKGTHTAFCEAVIQYFRYVRDFAGDSGLSKARKIERLTKQCIAALYSDQPGPTMIPIVLYLTNVLRQISINLDRDPDLLGITNASSSGPSSSSGDDEVMNISFVERCGNTLREAFNKIVRTARPTQHPSPDRLDHGLYLMINVLMRIYARVGKLRNADFVLMALNQNSPPLIYYPVSQRVTFLYYLGVFYFNSNQFFRAVECLQSAYDQCSKAQQFIHNRQLILTHLIASSFCVGRLPSRILLIDPAAHPISKPFAILYSIVKTGDIGFFQTFTDHALPLPLSESAQWLLSKKILLQIRNRCEMFVWRSLVYRAMKYGGFLGSSEEGKQGSMPWVRFTVIHEAACLSYARARKQVFDTTNGTIDLSGSLNSSGENGSWIDPDLIDDNSDEHSHHHNSTTADENDDDDESYFTSATTPNTDHSVDNAGHSDHPPLSNPTPAQINSIVLSLISQGFLKGFVQHTYPDLLQSRFAIPGVRALKGRNPNSASPASAQSNQQPTAWKEIGFPNIFDVVRAKEAEWGEEGEVPGWVTEAKVQRSQHQGGRVVNLSGARAAGA